MTLPVDSPAFFFSPGNWTGDQDRGGHVFRQSWYSGAYFRVTWTTPSETPSATLLLDTSPLAQIPGKPELSYNVDGVWTDAVPCNADEIKIAGLKGSGPHTLTIYFKVSAQDDRWGSADVSGRNVVRITGLQVDTGSTPDAAQPFSKWALIVGDSITEGSAADFGKSDNLSAWSYLVGQGLRARGYEYGVSACGYSGWLRRGDAPPGDVPAYYMISGSTDGQGGTHDDAASRWNKIDGYPHSLLDPKGHLSGYGKTGQEPSLILINYGTNDALNPFNPSDLRASITQALTALRRAAPHAAIYLIVPFGQYIVADLKAALDTYRGAAPEDNNVFLINLGKPAANALEADTYWGGLHPNLRGHATFACEILSQLRLR